MADARDVEMVKAYGGDPFNGHLSTPVSGSAFTKVFIGNLPAYRPGLSPILRGLEIGMAHGYFLVGPEVIVGPLRDSAYANFGGLITAMAIVLLGTAGMAAHGLVTYPNTKMADSEEPLRTSEGWSQLAGGFFIGGMGGAFVAYFFLENFEVLDSIFRGTIN